MICRSQRTKLTFLTICLLLPASATGQILDVLPPALCQTGDDRIEVLLLGSYHMSNPGLDQFNLEADDVLTSKRQSEIQELVERLADFRPTKVAVEAPFRDSTTVAQYREYVNGESELRRSEEEQIGFRLAKMLVP